MAGRVIVVGSVNVDYLLQVERLPAPGETVVGEELSRAAGGKGANAAAAAAALGAETTLIAAIGRDEDGERSARELEAVGVRCDALQQLDAATGAAMVLTDAGGENLIAVASGANRLLDPALAREALAQRAGPDTVVLVNFEVPDAVVTAVAEQAAEQRLTLVVDPAPARRMAAELVSACALITPNQHELGSLGFASAADLVAAGAGAVAVTLGDEGCLLHPGSAKPKRLPPYRVPVVDSVGAGDAFAAGASVGLAEGLGVEPAVTLGCAAGALACTGAGARGGGLNRARAEALVSRARAAAPRRDPARGGRAAP
ncbi:MAG TPA: PfkB family carbohydrate kinase [Thermoleophilaceae bacterium]|nr:PfkB family carbohydrate kinase [Thermoleophilaceae bacterium]